jgi:16S rRNA C1402 N4-methylase RsmH
MGGLREQRESRSAVADVNRLRRFHAVVAGAKSIDQLLGHNDGSALGRSRPSATEVAGNPRARSAIMRVAVRTTTAAGVRA